MKLTDILAKQKTDIFAHDAGPMAGGRTRRKQDLDLLERIKERYLPEQEFIELAKELSANEKSLDFGTVYDRLSEYVLNIGVPILDALLDAYPEAINNEDLFDSLLEPGGAFSTVMKNILLSPSTRPIVEDYIKNWKSNWESKQKK